MEGLEIAEVCLSNLEFTGRIDSEYYRPGHLRAENLITAKGAKPLASLCNFIIGPFGSAFTVENYTDDNTYRYIRGKDVKPMQLAENDNVFMPKADFKRLSKYALQTGDVLVSVVGTLGNAALVEERHLPAIFSCKSTALRINDIEPRYLVTYLNCKYGQDLLIRKERGAVQKGLNLEDLRSLNVYVAGAPLQNAIVKAHEKSEAERLLSQRQLREAESSLLQSLGLDAWTPPEALSYVRSSREAFAAGRLDAEHFQPKFETLIKLLTATGRSARLGDCLQMNQRGKQPEYGECGLPVVNSKHVQRNEVRVDDDNRCAAVEPGSLQIVTGDVLLNGTGVGTIGRSAAYLHETPALPDNHVTVLRPAQGLDPVYLAVYLNSVAGQLQVEQRLRGSSGQIELYPADIAEFQVWLAPDAVQQAIRAQVESSFEQRQHATRLLDAAKRAVEIAIEDSEAAALAFLESVA